MARDCFVEKFGTADFHLLLRYPQFIATSLHLTIKKAMQQHFNPNTIPQIANSLRYIPGLLPQELLRH